MKIFNFEDYRAFLSWKMAQPKDVKGDRQSQASVAAALCIHPSLFTRIMRGQRQLTPDQAFLASAHFRLDDSETGYFVALVHLERAAHKADKERIRRQLANLREEADASASLSETRHVLSAASQLRYYSSWHYSAIRLLTALPGYQGPRAVQKISETLNLAEDEVEKVLDFLLSTGLCVRAPGGKIQRSEKDTELGRDSPMIDRHLMNWRTKACEKIPNSTVPDLFHTAPLIASSAAAHEIRALLLEVIKATERAQKKDPPEKLFCLNIDWFDVIG